MKNLQINPKVFLRFLTRFNLVIFVVLVVLSLSAAVILLYGIVGQASTASPSSNPNTANFDQDTINRIEKLKTSTEPSEPLSLPQGRINPFVE